MEVDWLNELPSEILMHILSRLPPQSIMTCKCVCKSWLDLVNYHHSTSLPPLFLSNRTNPPSYKIFQLSDHRQFPLDSSPITQLYHEYPTGLYLASSVNGLILLRTYYDKTATELCLWNPMTGERIHLQLNRCTDCCGFGVSKTSGEYKVVAISTPDDEYQVYTMGTKSWRRIEGYCPHYKHEVHAINKDATLVNGCLHWLSDTPDCISCFDLETETFTMFCQPPFDFFDEMFLYYFDCLVALEGCLCLSVVTFDGDAVLWMMKDHGVEDSWTRIFVICSSVVYSSPAVYFRPIWVSKDGDRLMFLKEWDLFAYSKKDGNVEKIDLCRGTSENGATLDIRMRGLVYEPSFVSLKRFE